jgi:hypothetical protein
VISFFYKIRRNDLAAQWLLCDLPKGSRIITVGYDTSLTLWYVVFAYARVEVRVRVRARVKVVV